MTAEAPDLAGTTGRDAFRQALTEHAGQDHRIWCCDSDMGGIAQDFGAAHPDRYVDLGIAEATMMTTAAALAAAGKIPFAHTMASFAALRAGEQVKVDIAYNNLPVHIAATHGGLSGGHFGPTHQSLEDIAVMRALPNMTVVVPSDPATAARLVPLLAELSGPSYVRLGRRVTAPVGPVDRPFALGRAEVLREGGDVTLVACGPHPVLAALGAADRLAADGLGATVLDMATIKPLDVQALVAAAERTDRVITVEDHSIIGGLGSAVAEALAEHRPVPLRRIGVPDRFCDRVGSHEELLAYFGITDERVYRTALALYKGVDDL
ncbi:transketolase family protein [Streptomyces sp. B1I3]|uniref:transketolase family protein n=1 Tax=Streptomyces sp. B1I3 TaxID=3042264 RepID=UPI002780E1C8|nr:transketolase C-terminal domain-containing protein [Streptomyces sp. B1I3]MDQ0791663.1 transketolase [Streptomyces sp. B1I3]